MKNYVYLLCLVLLMGCKKEKPAPEGDSSNPVSPLETSQAFVLTDVKYGSDNQQVMDLYLPANRTSSTKVFILIHGGGWSAGSKADYTFMFDALKTVYPNCAIANIGYRLGTAQSPGFPKQIDDIRLALNHIQKPLYTLSKDYFIFGSSAGGHLAMLYAYGHDHNHQVKGVCNTVGPADFTDPSYVNNPVYDYALLSLVGNVTYAQNPQLYKEVSPALRVTALSPKTISFYGDQDPLVPATQITLLHNKLTQAGVYNESTLYAGEGHGNWSQANATDCMNKIVQFIQQHFL